MEIVHDNRVKKEERKSQLTVYR